jgi:hypothetical protein
VEEEDLSEAEDMNFLNVVGNDREGRAVVMITASNLKVSCCCGIHGMKMHCIAPVVFLSIFKYATSIVLCLLVVVLNGFYFSTELHVSMSGSE